MKFLAALVVALLVVAAFASHGYTPRTAVFHLGRLHTEDHIEAEFVARSTPDTDVFQQHLSVAQLTALVRGKQSSKALVSTFLQMTKGCAAITVSLTQDSLTCDLLPNTDLTALLARSASAKNFAPRTSALHLLPNGVREQLRAVVVVWSRNPGLTTPAKKPRLQLTQPGGPQTPQSIRERYRVPTTINFTIPPDYSNGVGEFEGEFFQASDISAFNTQYKLERPLKIEVLGPNPSSGADQIEGTLDLEYIGAISNGRVGLWWLAQSQNHQEPGNIDFHLWVDKVLNMTHVPAVISLSWGLGYQQYFFDMAVLNMDNDAFRKMGLVGTSLLAASGDSGPGTRTGIFNCDTFTPSWPASSSYLTSVGATYANSASEDEVAVSWSGGGFSTVFALPSWQKDAVQTYLSTATGLPKPTFYNASGRAYPDVSALGTNYEVFVQGQLESVSGTSCAAPCFAGIIGLIAAERQDKGKSTLGFINPMLYKLGNVGFDITQGASQDMNCFPLFPIPGFPAAKGWDAVTGLGTPRYDYLRARMV